MRKIYYLLALLVGLNLFTSCEEDDKAPVYTEPTTFVLNTPKYISGIYDLKNANAIQLTCSQPDYGFTASTKYTVEVSMTRDFETSIVLDTKYYKAKMDVDAQEVAVAMSKLLNVDEASFPTTPVPVYFRLQAAALDNLKVELPNSAITSNVIELPKVLGYYALPAVTLPKNVYITGTVSGWDWAKAYSMIPVHSKEGMFWSMQYLGEGEDGSKAAIKFNTAKAWDGNQVGISGVAISNVSKDFAGIGGTDNIEIGNPGWYIVIVTVTLDGRNYKYAVDFLKPQVYLNGDTAGGWDSFAEDDLFTVPSGPGEFVSPTFVAKGELRMCIKLDNTDWWKTEFIILNDKIVYRGAGEDQERYVVDAGKKAYLNFITNTGSVK